MIIIGHIDWSLNSHLKLMKFCYLVKLNAMSRDGVIVSIKCLWDLQLVLHLQLMLRLQ